MENSLFNRLVRETAMASSEDLRRENGKTGGSTGREQARSSDRRSRTEQAVRAAVYQAGLDGEPSGKRTEYGRQSARETQDRDFIAQDLDSLTRMEYVKMDDETGAGEDSRNGKDENGSRAKAQRAEEERSRETRRGGRAGKKSGKTSGVSEGEEERRDTDYLKSGLEQIAAGRERGRTDGEWIKDLSPDELELVGQILKQYLV